MQKKIIIVFFLCIYNIQLTIAQQFQWACKVLSCSEIYNNNDYSPMQALGKPDIYHLNKKASSKAWVMGFLNDNTESKNNVYLKVGFCTPIKAQQIVILESYSPGAITHIYIYDQNNVEYKVYETTPVNILQKKRILSVKFPLTEFKISAAKIIAQPSAISDWNCVDGIGISDDTSDFDIKINLSNQNNFLSEPINLGSNINTSYNEVYPIIAPDGQQLYFCRKEYPNNTDGIKDDIWVSNLGTDGNWMLATNIGKPLNNSGYNFICSITPDGNKVLLGNTYNPDGSNKGTGASMSIRNNNTWSVPKTLNIKNYYNNDKYVSFCLSNSAKVLLMTCDREDTYGLKDIYVSFNQDSIWTEPMNLGAEINSDKDECHVFLASDEKTLFFASERDYGYGSADIYYSKRLDDTWKHWSEPVNLGDSVNTSAWESNYSIDAAGTWAYFVSNKNSIGAADIVKIKLKNLKPEPVVLISGKVLDAKTNKPIESNIQYEILSNAQPVGKAISNANDGAYKITLPYGLQYAIYADAPGYIAISENIDLSQILNYQEIIMDLKMVPLEIGQIVRLNNIVFDQAKASLRSESFTELDRVVNLLKNNPKIMIEISGHTDNKGSDEADMVLSANRANVVRNYLIQKGIAAQRITAKGYGKTRPIANNNTEDGRKLNRRVEFKIMKM